jgi:hypothetical protein
MQNVLNLGLIETTSNVQRKNGTIRLHDPAMGVDYLSYESGYVRRGYKQTSWYRPNHTESVLYQLNLTQVGPAGTARIMIPLESDRLDRISHCVTVYRNNFENK